MGAWGTSALENDDAMEFLATLSHTRRNLRVAKLQTAFDAYLEFHERLQTGQNISVMSESQVQAMIASREAAIAVNQHTPFSITDLIPWMATPETWEAHVRELAEPRVDEGVTEALRATAAAWALAAALNVLDAGGHTHHLGAVAQADLQAAVPAARTAVSLILRNEPLRLSWSESADAWAAELEDIQSGLSRATALQ